MRKREPHLAVGILDGALTFTLGQYTYNNALNYRSLRTPDVQKLRFCPPVSFTLAVSLSRVFKEVI